jgi:hypothetical protein
MMMMRMVTMDIGVPPFPSQLTAPLRTSGSLPPAYPRHEF